MKVKICRQCGKQNDENAWNCVDCGATLSMKTLVDTYDLQTPHAAMAGKGVLSGVSSYFQEDLTELLKGALHPDESVVRGADICRVSVVPPYRFGYLVVTSQQLLRVYFSSETEVHLIGGVLPKRPYSDIDPLLGGIVQGQPSGRPRPHLVNRLDSPLTLEEKRSREVTAFLLKESYSVKLESDLYVTVKFSQADGITLRGETITFYFNDEAFNVERLLEEQIKKRR